MEKLITKSFKRLLDKGVHRGFITHEELGKSLGKRHYSQDNIEKAFLFIFDNKVCLVEKKSEYRSQKKKEATSSENEKSNELDKSDDPIRMYLREMGGVELLSREGEIAIAKRIEAGKNVMIGELFQSPLTAKKVNEWKDQFEKNELLVREIIDIDSTYMDIESEGGFKLSKKNKEEDKKLEKNKKEDDRNEEGEQSSADKEKEFTDDDEFNPSLAAMEEEIKPKIISSIESLCKDYKKLTKVQSEKLQYALNAKEFSRAREKNYKKMQEAIIEKVKNLQLNPTVIEDLVQAHYVENKRIVSLEGLLLRSAMEHKITREEFLKYYLGNEINPNFQTYLNQNSTWKNFFNKKKKEFNEIRERLIEFSTKIGLPMIEGMICGTIPITCSDNLTAKEFSPSDFICEPDPQSIVNKIEQLDKDYENKRKIAIKFGEKYKVQFNKKNITKNIINLFNSKQNKKKNENYNHFNF